MKSSDFAIPDQNDKLRRLSDFKGKWVILYFYPKDNTPGCTKEACGFRDSSQEFEKRGAVVLGVSKDSPASHRKFAKKHNLSFLLLSDQEKRVMRSYQAWGKKSFLGKTYEGTLRKTFLIDPQGKIKKVYEKVNPLTHAAEILKDLKDLSAA